MRRDQSIRSILLLLLFISPFFMAMTDSSVWDANEAFYVETPREMVQSGDWLVPHFNGEPRLNKPPLSYWLVAVLYRFFGTGLVWERVLMAILASISVLAVFAIARLLYDFEIGLLGAGIFATTFRFLIVSRRLLIDALVLCCILAGIALFLYWKKTRWNPTAVASAICFGLAFLAKGPVAGLPCIFLGLYCLLPANRDCLAGFPWKSAVPAFLAVAGSWFLALGLMHGWGPVRDFFISENLGRFTVQDFGPRRGLGYYFGVFLGDFFPWSLPFLGLVAASIAGWFRKPRIREPRESRIASLPGNTFFLAAWCLTYFLIFSLSRNKQEYYILPMYPAAAILLASAAGRVSRLMRASWIISGAMLLLLPPLIWFLNNELFAESSAPWWLPATAAAIAGFCLIRRQLILGILGLILFYQGAFFAFSIPLEDYKPVAPLAETIRNSAGTADYTAGYYRFTAPSLRFYLDRDIHEIYDLDEAASLLLAPDEVFLITDAEGLAELEEATAGRIGVVANRRKISSRLRTLLARLKNHEPRESAWSSPVYLVTNRTRDPENP